MGCQMESTVRRINAATLMKRNHPLAAQVSCLGVKANMTRAGTGAWKHHNAVVALNGANNNSYTTMHHFHVSKASQADFAGKKFPTHLPFLTV